jgi:hypothetical protein
MVIVLLIDIHQISLFNITALHNYLYKYDYLNFHYSIYTDI